MNTPIALLDANVLYDVVVRDLLIQLAVAGIYRARWTRRITDEWTRNLLADRPDIPANQIDITVALMRRAIPDAVVEGYDSHIEMLHLPDPGDCHVLAAAVTAGADALVTFNLKHFPTATLQGYGIEPCSPDDFVMSLTETDANSVISAARSCQTRLARLPLLPSAYLAVLSRHGFRATAEFLGVAGMK